MKIESAQNQKSQQKRRCTCDFMCLLFSEHGRFAGSVAVRVWRITCITERRPELKMARSVELHSKADAEKVRAAWMPQVSLTVGFCLIRVTVLDDQISRGVGFLQIRADVQNSVSFCVLLFSGSPADAELWSIGVGRRHSGVLRTGRCGRIRGELATAHSLLPESAGSRSPERRRQGVDAVATGPPHSDLSAEC